VVKCKRNPNSASWLATIADFIEKWPHSVWGRELVKELLSFSFWQYWRMNSESYGC
jgi:hypothetical protein